MSTLSEQEIMARLGGTSRPAPPSARKGKGKEVQPLLDAIPIDPSLEDILSSLPPVSASTSAILNQIKEESALGQSISKTLVFLSESRKKEDSTIKDLESSRALSLLLSELDKPSSSNPKTSLPLVQKSLPVISQRLSSQLSVIKSLAARTSLLHGIIEDIHNNAYQLGYSAAEAALTESEGIRNVIRGLVKEAIASERRSEGEDAGEEAEDEGEVKAGMKRKRGNEGQKKAPPRRKDTVLQNKLHYAVHLLVLKQYRPTSTKGDVVPEGPNVVDDWPDSVPWGQGGKMELRTWDARNGREQVDLVWRPPFTEVRNQDTQDFIQAVTQLILSHLPSYSFEVVKEATTTYVQNIGKAIAQKMDVAKSEAQRVKSAVTRRVRRRETTRSAREEFIDSSPLAYISNFHWIKPALTMIEAIPDYLSDDEEGRYVVDRPEGGMMLGGQDGSGYFSEYEFYREKGLAGAVAIANGKKWEIRDQDWLDPFLIRCSMVLDEFIITKDTQGRFNRTPTWRGPPEKRSRDGETAYPAVRPKIPETGEPNPLSSAGAVIFKSMVREDLRRADPAFERRLYEDPPNPADGGMGLGGAGEEGMTLDQVMARPEWQELKLAVGKRLMKIPGYVDLDSARAEWALSRAWPVHGLMQ